MKAPLEIFSVQIDPPSTKKGSSAIMRLFSTGEFILSEVDSYTMDEKIISSNAIKLKNDDFLAKLTSIVQKGFLSLSSSPSNLKIKDYEGSQYVLCLQDKIISGDYAFGNLDEVELGFSKEETKKIKWNNKAVSLINQISDSIYGKDMVGSLLKETSLVHLLKPVNRYIIYLSLNESNGFFEPVIGIDSAIKAGLKKALEGHEPLGGEPYNQAFVTLRQKALSFLDTSRTVEAFEKGHSSICHSLMDIPGFDYSLAAYALDLTYIYLLLEGSLINDERKVAFLHSPLSPSDIVDLEGTGDEGSYKRLVKESSHECSLLSISPAYMFLESVFYKAHPKKNDGPLGVERSA